MTYGGKLMTFEKLLIIIGVLIIFCYESFKVSTRKMYESQFILFLWLQNKLKYEVPKKKGK